MPLPQDLLTRHYPVAAFADRYGGVYSGGRWFALSAADEPFQGEVRASWVLSNGPSGEDIEAAIFWADPPAWIASGDTPQEAVSALDQRSGS
jgi:hypothetical protein